MPKHLIKCRRSHSSAGTKECRFNCTHVHPIEEIAVSLQDLNDRAFRWIFFVFLQYHEALCSDRLTVELDMTKKPELNPKAPQDSGFIQGPQHSARDADWDNLVSCASRRSNLTLTWNFHRNQFQLTMQRSFAVIMMSCFTFSTELHRQERLSVIRNTKDWQWFETTRFREHRPLSLTSTTTTASKSSKD